MSDDSSDDSPQDAAELDLTDLDATAAKASATPASAQVASASPDGAAKEVEGSGQWPLLFVDRLKAIAARSVMLLEMMFLAIAIGKNVPLLYWLLFGVAVSSFLLEMAWRCYMWSGQEGKWFCPCFALYIVCCVPFAWLSHFRRGFNFQALNHTSPTGYDIPKDFVPVRVNMDAVSLVAEQTLVFLFVLCRWILPRGEMSRSQLSRLLILYITIASDNVELFVLFDAEEIQGDDMMIVITLTIWTLSLVPFTIVLTMTKDPQEQRSGQGFINGLLNTEIWGLLVQLTMQDVPYAFLRVFAVFKYKLYNYTIFFFISKNLLNIGIGLYRVAVLAGQRRRGIYEYEE